MECEPRSVGRRGASVTVSPFEAQRGTSPGAPPSHVVRILRGRVSGRAAEGVGGRFRAKIFHVDRRHPKTTPDPLTCCTGVRLRKNLAA